MKKKEVQVQNALQISTQTARKKNRRALEWPLKHTLTSDVRRKMTLKMAWSRRFWISGEMLGKNWEVGFHVYLIWLDQISPPSTLLRVFLLPKTSLLHPILPPLPERTNRLYWSAVIRVEIYNRGKEVDKWRHKTVYSSVIHTLVYY